MSSFRLKVKINYDERFFLKFGQESVNVIRRVAAHASSMFLLPSLVQPIVWDITLGIKIPASIIVGDTGM